MPGFWDASAVTGLFVPNQDGGRSRRLLQEQPPVVWWGTAIEVMSAARRLEREGVLSGGQIEVISTRLEALQRAWREIVPSSKVRGVALEVLRRSDLRAADAIQLAAALVWCGGRSKNRTFVCKDRRLSEAARREGFVVVE